jgi:hypothetical protein
MMSFAEVSFELLLSVVLAKRRPWRVSVRAYLPFQYRPGGAKQRKKRISFPADKP